MHFAACLPRSNKDTGSSLIMCAGDGVALGDDGFIAMFIYQAMEPWSLLQCCLPSTGISIL